MSGVRRVLRRILRLPAFVITREEARELARAAATSKGWPWKEPVLEGETLRSFTFWTDSMMRGGNVSVEIDGGSGAVRHIAIARR